MLLPLENLGTAAHRDTTLGQRCQPKFPHFSVHFSSHPCASPGSPKFLRIASSDPEVSPQTSALRQHRLHSHPGSRVLVHRPGAARFCSSPGKPSGCCSFPDWILKPRNRSQGKHPKPARNNTGKALRRAGRRQSCTPNPKPGTDPKCCRTKTPKPPRGAQEHPQGLGFWSNPSWDFTRENCAGLVVLAERGWGQGGTGWDRAGTARWPYLCLGEAEAAGQLLALGAHHVVVLLEGPLQAQQLRRGKGRADALGLAGEGAVQQEALLGHLAPCGHTQSSGQPRHARSPLGRADFLPP